MTTVTRKTGVSATCPFVSRICSCQAADRPGPSPSRSDGIEVAIAICVAGGRSGSDTPASGSGGPRLSASGPTRTLTSSIPQSSKPLPVTGTSSATWSVSVSGMVSTTIDGGRSTVGTISTGGTGRLACPCGLRNSTVAHTGFSTGTRPSHAAPSDGSPPSDRASAIAPAGRSTGCFTRSCVRSTQPGRSKTARPRSTEKAAPPIGLPAIGASNRIGAASRAHSPGAGSGPATTLAALVTGGAFAASPQMTTVRPRSWSSRSETAAGGSVGSSRAMTDNERLSGRSFGSTSGSSRVRMATMGRSAPQAKLRRPPAACEVVHRQGVSETASRGRSSSNQIRSSTRSTSVLSMDRWKSRTLPSAASADAVASNSTVLPSGAVILAASSATGSGRSIRM